MAYAKHKANLAHSFDQCQELNQRIYGEPKEMAQMISVLTKVLEGWSASSVRARYASRLELAASGDGLAIERICEWYSDHLDCQAARRMEKAMDRIIEQTSLRNLVLWFLDPLPVHGWKVTQKQILKAIFGNLVRAATNRVPRLKFS